MTANEINVVIFSGAQAAHVLVQSRTSCEATYTVVSGDNCVEIAAKFNVTDASLLAANPVRLKNFHPLLSQKLCIPVAPVSCRAEYIVKPGDVCISIANMFHITAAQLEAANSKIDPLCDNLQNGEILCIPTASQT
ncbi:carbohydrate-binding module family 50 protein [Lentinula edodes]|uniref:Carbohydrate-binding module family 50 protein n=1 Tax=Lentinula edodes TaxID=5353 RepID=A0A1Q3EF49_LENED|nr:carbohydrate-binding module family 50 protein [Lentinula edodes]